MYLDEERRFIHTTTLILGYQITRKKDLISLMSRLTGKATLCTRNLKLLEKALDDDGIVIDKMYDTCLGGVCQGLKIVVGYRVTNGQDVSSLTCLPMQCHGKNIVIFAGIRFGNTFSNAFAVPDTFRFSAN
jgi:hypothetical protein